MPMSGNAPLTAKKNARTRSLRTQRRCFSKPSSSLSAQPFLNANQRESNRGQDCNRCDIAAHVAAHHPGDEEGDEDSIDRRVHTCSLRCSLAAPRPVFRRLPARRISATTTTTDEITTAAADPFSVNEESVRDCRENQCCKQCFHNYLLSLPGTFHICPNHHLRRRIRPTTPSAAGGPAKSSTGLPGIASLSCR